MQPRLVLYYPKARPTTPSMLGQGGRLEEGPAPRGGIPPVPRAPVEERVAAEASPGCRAASLAAEASPAAEQPRWAAFSQGSLLAHWLLLSRVDV